MNHSEAGKGSTPRPTNQQKYADNYDLIFGKKTATPASVPPKQDSQQNPPKLG